MPRTSAMTEINQVMTYFVAFTIGPPDDHIISILPVHCPIPFSILPYPTCAVLRYSSSTVLALWFNNYQTPYWMPHTTCYVCFTIVIILIPTSTTSISELLVKKRYLNTNALLIDMVFRASLTLFKYIFLYYINASISYRFIQITVPKHINLHLTRIQRNAFMIAINVVGTSTCNAYLDLIV